METKIYEQIYSLQYFLEWPCVCHQWFTDNMSSIALSVLQENQQVFSWKKKKKN